MVEAPWALLLWLLFALLQPCIDARLGRQEQGTELGRRAESQRRLDTALGFISKLRRDEQRLGKQLDQQRGAGTCFSDEADFKQPIDGAWLVKEDMTSLWVSALLFSLAFHHQMS